MSRSHRLTRASASWLKGDDLIANSTPWILAASSGSPLQKKVYLSPTAAKETESGDVDVVVSELGCDEHYAPWWAHTGCGNLGIHHCANVPDGGLIAICCLTPVNKYSIFCVSAAQGMSWRVLLSAQEEAMRTRIASPFLGSLS